MPREKAKYEIHSKFDTLRPHTEHDGGGISRDLLGE
jgi:hypothetical protein